MATESVATKQILLSRVDVQDFNDALSLIYIASSIDTPSSVDEAVHLRNVCRMATQKLCDIRNRLNPESIEVEA